MTVLLRSLRGKLRLPDVLLLHPYEITVGLLTIVTGLAALWFGNPMSGLVDRDLGRAVAFVWQFLLMAGGGMALLGLWKHKKNWGSAIEAAGLLTIVTCCVVYIWAYVDGATDVASNLFVLELVSGMGIGCALRVRAIRRSEKIILRTLEDAAARRGNGE